MKPSKPQGRVQLFHTCLINEIYPEVGISVVKILEYLGLQVAIPRRQTCCGQPAFNSGFTADARRIALHTIDLLAQTDGDIIIPSGSCGDMIIHEYRVLFTDDHQVLAKIDALVPRCFEFSQFLVDKLGITDLSARLQAKVAYHPSCHLLRGLGIKDQPEILLQNVAGIDLVSFADQEECCGFGGVFSIDKPEISASMLNNKINCVQASQAEMVVSCDMGCLLHLEGGLNRDGSKIKVRHIAQVLSSGIGV